MHAVEDDADWHLIARTTGEPVGEPIKARELMREIAEAAWRCADPGVQYDTTINQWHTSPNSGRINASNPCSRVHARGRLGVQPGVAEPDEVPPAGRLVRRRGLPAHGGHRAAGAGDRRLAVELPDRGDRRQRARVPPARPRLRQPRRVPDGQRLRLRLRRGSRRGGRDHGADDGPRVRAVGAGSPRRWARTTATRRTARRTTTSCACTATRPTRCRTAPSTDDAAAGRRARDVERGRRARRALRLPQRAGDGARAHGDDLVPDGLRHDRHRARLLARQVQGARRRRQHGHRQPHGADGAAHARLRRGADRADRGLRRRARHDRRRARPARPSTCRCSTSRSASARSRTPATSR